MDQKYNVLTFHTKIRSGKAYAVEQKIREFKKILQKSKRMHKLTSTKRIELKKLIQCSTNNLNSIASQKYGVSPIFVEENMQQHEKFCEIFYFCSLVKVQKYAKRYTRNDIRQDNKNRKKLREPLVLGKTFFILSGRLKKDVPGVFYNSTTEIKPFFNRDEIFFIRRIAFINILTITGFQK